MATAVGLLDLTAWLPAGQEKPGGSHMCEAARETAVETRYMKNHQFLRWDLMGFDLIRVNSLFHFFG